MKPLAKFHETSLLTLKKINYKMKTKKYQGNQHKEIKPNIIPRDYLEDFCYGDVSDKIVACDYYSSPDCPEICDWSIRIRRNSCKTGLERFMNRYPDYGGDIDTESKLTEEDIYGKI